VLLHCLFLYSFCKLVTNHCLQLKVCDNMASKSTGKEHLSLKNTRNTSIRRTSAKSKTPLKNIMSGFDRKKSRSSMKKIKVVSKCY